MKKRVRVKSMRMKKIKRMKSIQMENSIERKATFKCLLKSSTIG